MRDLCDKARLRLASTATAVAGALLLLWAPHVADAAWDGTQDIRLGDTISAEFKAAPLLEVHDYSFYAPKGTVLSLTCTADKTAAGLVPDVNLFTDMDAAVPFGAAQTGNTVKNFTFTGSGDYYLKLRATAGTGIYKLTSKPKFPTSASGAETTGAFQFDALAGTVMGVSVKATKGSTATPNITALTYQGGAVDLTTLPKRLTKVGALRTSFSKALLPVNGTYTLAIDPGTAGQSVDVKVTLAPPKTGRIWNFGFVEDPMGLPSENRTKWLGSPHADHTDTPFNAWNTTNPPAVPNTCARCHTTSGYRDYIGADGTPANDWTTAGNGGKADNSAPIGQVITCDACHNDATAKMTSVMFPSQLTVTGLGKEARCMVCHQGRESTVSVEAAIAAAAPGDVDTVMTGVGFKNIHYLAAAATLYGHEAQGGYEYPDPAKADPTKYYFDPVTKLQPRLQYDVKFPHVTGPFGGADMDTCIGCHDPHSTELHVTDRCASCHVNAAGNAVATKADLHDIRMAGTTADFDGNGKLEGVYYEIAGLRAILLQAIQDYAGTVPGRKIGYTPDSYPYFFYDTNGDGSIDASEAVFANAYKSFTARLYRATYNYQFSVKDPGAYAHNAKYVIELLYDSIADLNAKTGTVANFASLVRNDDTHFDGNAEPYRHWEHDAQPSGATAAAAQPTPPAVDIGCGRCHSPEGFKFVVANNIDPTVTMPRANGMNCESCHEDGTLFSPTTTNTNVDQFGNRKPSRRYVASVTFPFATQPTATTGTASTVIPSTQAQITAVTIFNGAKGTAAQDDSFVCMTCHRARESKLTLDAADPTGATTTWTLSFKNSHYLAAGATLYGSKAAVMYQYPSMAYAQRWDHQQAYSKPYAVNAGVPVSADASGQCTYCHMENGNHEFKVELGPGTVCAVCHPATTADQIVPLGGDVNSGLGYDNDATTPPKAELAVFEARLLAAIQAYCAAATDAGTAGAQYVVYNGAAYPYFVKDANKNGVWDAGETTSIKCDTKAFRATFNYNFSVKEPNCWAHNRKYVLQCLFDSIQDLGGDVTNLTRPN